ncbi:PTS sugar transporter subunit IIA [Pannonibacter sp. Pt2-lr]|uniref:PTS sugar transporter subunit IIA n=1 Tax=Pannonibacter anstelovis TaxID=3121537 RepID=A0ABU7ZLI4_9HYPH
MTQSLADCVVEDGIFLKTQAQDATSVIGLLAGHLRDKGLVADTYVQAVIDREKVMPTGLPMEDGLAVAVPHTDPQHVIRSGIAIATLAAPVAFASMDDPDNQLAVQVVFALALKSKDEQIGMLQSIGRLLQDGARIRKLIEASDPQDARALLNAA